MVNPRHSRRPVTETSPAGAFHGPGGEAGFAAASPDHGAAPRSGTALRENDDHRGAGLAGSTDSRIRETLAAGTYTVEATTYQAGETGSFTLTVSGL